jgi:hypothetical protein
VHSVIVATILEVLFEALTHLTSPIGGNGHVTEVEQAVLE